MYIVSINLKMALSVENGPPREEIEFNSISEIESILVKPFKLKIKDHKIYMEEFPIGVIQQGDLQV